MNGETKKTVVVEMNKDKDCKGSVRFTTTEPLQAVDNVYVSRIMEGINGAQRIRVTVEIIG